MSDELEVFDFGEVTAPTEHPWLVRYTPQSVRVEVRYRADDRYDVRFAEGAETVHTAAELAEMGMTSAPPATYQGAAPMPTAKPPRKPRQPKTPVEAPALVASSRIDAAPWTRLWSKPSAAGTHVAGVRQRADSNVDLCQRCHDHGPDCRPHVLDAWTVSLFYSDVEPPAPKPFVPANVPPAIPVSIPNIRRILGLADGSLARLSVELLEHGGPEGRELSNWLKDHIPVDDIEDFDADENEARDGELEDANTKADRYQKLIGETVTRLRKLHDQVSGPDVTDELSGHVESLADALDNAETEITDDSDPWDKADPWYAVSAVARIKFHDPQNANDLRQDLATTEAALAEARRYQAIAEEKLRGAADAWAKLKAQHDETVALLTRLREENADLRAHAHVPTATVSVEIADALGMRELPNTVVLSEHPNVTRVRSELLRRKATPSDRIKAMALLDTADWTRQATDCTKDADAEKLSLRLIKAAKGDA